MLRAAAGQGQDPPPEAERAKYRARALGWLRRLLKAQQERLAKDFNANRYAIETSLRVVLQHRDLAPVRGAALDGVPAAEREEWDNLWNSVEALLDKATSPARESAVGQGP